MNVNNLIYKIEEYLNWSLKKEQVEKNFVASPVATISSKEDSRNLTVVNEVNRNKA